MAGIADLASLLVLAGVIQYFSGFLVGLVCALSGNIDLVASFTLQFLANLDLNHFQTFQSSQIECILVGDILVIKDDS